MTLHEVNFCLLEHPYILFLSCTLLCLDLTLFADCFCLIVVLNKLLLKVFSLGKHDLVLLLHL